MPKGRCDFRDHGFLWRGEMNSKLDTRQNGLDMLRWIASGAVLIAAVGGFYVLSEQSVLYAVLLLLAALGIAVAIVWSTAIGLQVRSFLAEARMEVRKVVWPTRQRTMQITLYVLLMVIVVGIFLWLLDMFFLWIVELATGRGN